MNEKLLPADIYIVVNKTIISNEDRKKITMLYQPIIGHTAVSLYFTLIDDLEKREFMSEELTHHHLVCTMKTKLTDIIIAREKLEAIGLLKTYFKEDNVNNYIYVLYSPLSINEFFNHPVLSVVLYNNLGKKEYEKLVNYFKVPKINLKDYKEITASFSSIFSITGGNTSVNIEDIVDKNIGSIKIDEKIDFPLLISSIPKSLVSERCFNEDTKNLINSLAFTYNIDDLHMQGLVRNSLNEKGLVDKDELIKSARNLYQYDNAGKLPTLVYSKQPEYLKNPIGDTSKRARMIYTFENITPYDYLKSKYKHGEPTASELQIVEELMTKQKLKPGVVNVLLSYVLNVSNNKLPKKLIDSIAAQWCKLNIETVEDAMNIAEKEHKKLKKMTEKTSTNKTSSKTKETITGTPSWFGKNIEKQEISKEEQEYFDNLINNF
jgi:replication initiation and membrane attachment protein